MIAGHLQEKKGLYYMVLSYKDKSGRTGIKMDADWTASEGEQKTRRRHADGRPRRICGGRSRY